MLNNFPLWPEQASTMAGHVDALYIFLLIVTGMMTLLIFTCLVYFAARFRYRPGVPAEQIEGSTPLEITWSAIPFLIFMVILGRLGLFQRTHSARGCGRNLCRR
jgi:cytochrome c oxidase subunit 2